MLDQLTGWMRRYNSFQDQLRPYKNQIEVMQQNQRVLKEQRDSYSVRLNRSESQQHQLRQHLWDYEDFVKSIPDDLRQDLVRQFQQEQNRDVELRLESE